MNRACFRLAPVCSALLLLGIASTHAACSSDEDPPATSAAQSDAGPGPTVPGEDASVPGEEEEGAPVTEDGDIPEIVPSDASAEEVGPDGGLVFQPGCVSVTPGGYVASTCSSRLTMFTSAEFTSGTYLLTSVRALGNTTFCSNTFKVLEHAGALVVTATSPTTATLSFYEKFRAPAKPLVTAVNRYQVAATATGTDLSLAVPICTSGTPAPATAKITTGTTVEGKKLIVLQLPYGASGKAIYRFVEP